MAKTDEASAHDLYIAAYGDGSVAEQAWDAVRLLAADKVIELEALALVNRASDGKIHVKDIGHETGIGATIGAVGGVLAGLIFPPSLSQLLPWAVRSGPAPAPWSTASPRGRSKQTSSRRSPQAAQGFW